MDNNNAINEEIMGKTLQTKSITFAYVKNRDALLQMKVAEALFNTEFLSNN